MPVKEINTLLASSWPRLSDGWVRELRDGLDATGAPVTTAN